MWFALALLAAFTQGAQFAVVKARARDVPPAVMILWTQTLSLGVWASYFAASGATYRVPPGMWAWVLLAVALAGAMSYLLVRASAGGDISIVGPVLATSPVFSIVPDLVLSGTLPRGPGWLGIALSVAGTVTLSRTPGGRFSLHALLRREDALCALGAAVILGLLSGVDRRNALLAGVPSYLLSLHAVMWSACALLVALRFPRAFVEALRVPRLLAVLAHGSLVTAGTVLLMIAMTMAPAAYVNSVRRTGALLAVLLGHALFDEPALASRLTGAVVALLGAVLLLLG